MTIAFTLAFIAAVWFGFGIGVMWGTWNRGGRGR